MLNRERLCPRLLNYRPPRIAMTLLLAASVFELALPAFSTPFPAAPLGGGLLAVLGFGVMLRAWWLFRSRGTAICPTATTTTLITDDVYRLTRNPMYLGIVLMLLGTAVATGVLAYYVAAIAFWLIMDFVFCPYEETKLARDLPAVFGQYSTRVRRWL